MYRDWPRKGWSRLLMLNIEAFILLLPLKWLQALTDPSKKIHHLNS